MEVKGQQLEQILGVSRSRERDRELKTNPQGPELVSKKFSEWIKRADQIKNEVDKGEKPEPIIITNSSPYEANSSKDEVNSMWGEWPENRKQLENSKNLCYRLAEVGIIEGIEIGRRNQVDLSNTIYKDNLTGAVLAMASNEAYLEALSFVKEYNNPNKISKMLATKIMGRYLSNILGALVTIPELREPVIEFVRSIRKRMSEEIKMYTGFGHANREDSQELKSLDLKLKEAEDLTKKVENTDEQVPEGWLFYASAERWPNISVEKCIASHCPDFPIEDYFSRVNCCAGVLLTGEPFKFFSTDMSTSSDELAMGEDWDIEKYIVDHMADIYQSAESDNIDVDQVLDNMRAQNKYNCSSLSEAWTTRTGISNVYTEIWMKNSKAYAIWIDKEWEDKILLFFDRYSLKKLLTQRSELPVLDTDGSLMDRQQIWNTILKIESRKV